MEAPARLKWFKADPGFKAYPIGPMNSECFAEIDLYHKSVGGDAQALIVREDWRWRVHWKGWFNRAGFAYSKQSAADMATENWWEMIQTEVPRDVDLEAAMIVARVLVRPPPNSLFDEDNDFLTKVRWQMRNAYGSALDAKTALLQVTNLMEQIDDELDRRRASGTLVDPKPYVPSHPGPRRRRR